MDDFRDDYYEILGVSHTAPAPEIRDCYIKLSKKNHPDQGGSDRIMQMLNEAYDVLGDATKRARYDLWLNHDQTTATAASAAASAAASGRSYSADAGNQAGSAADSAAGSILEVTMGFGSVSMPLICACCLKPYDQAVKLPSTSRGVKDNTLILSKIKVPMCKECLKHVRKYQRIASLVALLAGILAATIQSGVFNLFKINPYLAALPAFLILLPIYHLFVKKPPVMTAAHSTQDYPIKLLFTQKQVIFTFYNPAYGKIFLARNPGAFAVRSIADKKEITRFVHKSRFQLFVVSALVWTSLLCVFTGCTLSGLSKEPDPSTNTSGSTIQTGQLTKQTTSVPVLISSVAASSSLAPTTAAPTKAAPTTTAPTTSYPYPTQKKPATGLFKSYTSSSKVAPFTVKTSKDGADYFVKLVDTATNKVAYEFYIADGETLSTKIALGTYVLKYASGSAWYGTERLFGPETSYLAGSDELKFYKSGTTIYGFTVTLYKVAGGNFDTKKINPTDF